MQSGAEQLRDWMARRWPESSRPQRDTAEYLGWDETFVTKVVNGVRYPGLANAIMLERKTGIPVEAWVSTELDKAGEADTNNRRKPVARQGGKRRVA